MMHASHALRPWGQCGVLAAPEEGLAPRAAKGESTCVSTPVVVGALQVDSRLCPPSCLDSSHSVMHGADMSVRY